MRAYDPQSTKIWTAIFVVNILPVALIWWLCSGGSNASVGRWSVAILVIAFAMTILEHMAWDQFVLKKPREETGWSDRVSLVTLLICAALLGVTLWWVPAREHDADESIRRQSAEREERARQMKQAEAGAAAVQKMRERAAATRNTAATTRSTDASK